MKKIVVYIIILLTNMLNSMPPEVAKKSFQNYLEQEAQNTINRYNQQSATDFSKAVLVCNFLNNNAHFATFPANTTITIRNRQYVKTQDTFYGNWCIVLPKETTPSTNSTQPKPKLIFIPNKESLPRLPIQHTYARSSKRHRDE